MLQKFAALSDRRKTIVVISAGAGAFILSFGGAWLFGTFFMS
ncbi:hypothetical protein [Alkalicoccus chagannorensis]|nr:hypothetical protein [Alkalicoccus chagannorensis]